MRSPNAQGASPCLTAAQRIWLGRRVIVGRDPSPKTASAREFLKISADQFLLPALIVALPICLGWFYFWAAKNAPWLATIILVLGAILVVLWAYSLFTSH